MNGGGFNLCFFMLSRMQFWLHLMMDTTQHPRSNVRDAILNSYICDYLCWNLRGSEMETKLYVEYFCAQPCAKCCSGHGEGRELVWLPSSPFSFTHWAAVALRKEEALLSSHVCLGHPLASWVPCAVTESDGSSAALHLERESAGVLTIRKEGYTEDDGETLQEKARLRGFVLVFAEIWSPRVEALPPSSAP